LFFASRKLVTLDGTNFSSSPINGESSCPAQLNLPGL
jgi:hypothetical protein